MIGAAGLGLAHLCADPWCLACDLSSRTGPSRGGAGRSWLDRSLSLKAHHCGVRPTGPSSVSASLPLTKGRLQMPSLPSLTVITNLAVEALVFGGVDTHAATHTVAAVNQQG